MKWLFTCILLLLCHHIALKHINNVYLFVLFLCTMWNFKEVLRRFHSKYKQWKHWKAVCNHTTDDFFFSRTLYWVKNQARLTIPWHVMDTKCPRAGALTKTLLHFLAWPLTLKSCSQVSDPPHRRSDTQKDAHQQTRLQTVFTQYSHSGAAWLLSVVGGGGGSGEWGGQCSVVVQMQ